jgi:hypothetical protein
MTPAVELPENGDQQIGSLRLPVGRRTLLNQWPGQTGGPPVAWVTASPVPGTGTAWIELSESSPRTGLVPFIARSFYFDPSRLWDGGDFSHPADLAEIDQFDPAVILPDRRQPGQIPDLGLLVGLAAESPLAQLSLRTATGWRVARLSTEGRAGRLSAYSYEA